jgi:hypothetical protein
MAASQYYRPPPLLTHACPIFGYCVPLLFLTFADAFVHQEKGKSEERRRKERKKVRLNRGGGGTFFKE